MARRKAFDQAWVPEPGTVLDERYRLNEMVDRGGMGVIMRGEHIRMKREVAVKLLSPDIATESGYRARFRREVDLSATIEHPNIVRCYDFGETSEGVLYLVMELLDGHSLKELMITERRFSARRVAELIVQALDGMSTAHQQKIVHRDLKPSNVFVVQDHRGDDVVKVLDFGLAKSLTSSHLTLTKKGAVCGTASYVAPEALVLQEVGTGGDVYAVGLIMLEMLVGRKVCQSRATAQTFMQHLVVPARIPRRVWESPLGPILVRALTKHPDDRYADAEEMFQAMRVVVQDVPDFILEPHELPPLPPDNLDNSLLMKLGGGEYATLDALYEMPKPEPWDPPMSEEADTLRDGIHSDIQALDTLDLAPTNPQPLVQLTAQPVSELASGDDGDAEAEEVAPPRKPSTDELEREREGEEPEPEQLERLVVTEDVSEPTSPPRSGGLVWIALALGLGTLAILLMN